LLRYGRHRRLPLLFDGPLVPLAGRDRAALLLGLGPVLQVAERMLIPQPLGAQGVQAPDDAIVAAGQEQQRGNEQRNRDAL
jgi:hypothetical protein